MTKKSKEVGMEISLTEEELRRAVLFWLRSNEVVDDTTDTTVVFLNGKNGRPTKVLAVASTSVRTKDPAGGDI